MTILAIETTGKIASVAIFRDGNVVCMLGKEEMSHLSESVPIIDSLLEKEGVAPGDIDAIAVSAGPGSFTGIRIGMATAKGLAQVWDKPIVEVPTLESFAYVPLPIGFDTVICPVFDARRSQVYAAAIRRTKNGPKMIIPEGAYSLEEYLETLAERLGRDDCAMFFGDGSIKFRNEIADGMDAEGFPGDVEFAEECVYQSADSIALLGAKLFKEGKVTDAFSAKPNYLRAAEPDRQKKSQEKKNV